MLAYIRRCRLIILGIFVVIIILSFYGFLSNVKILDKSEVKFGNIDNPILIGNAKENSVPVILKCGNVINFDLYFNSSGDVITYEVDIINNYNKDFKIKSISLENNEFNNDISYFLRYFDNNNDILEGDIINKNSSVKTILEFNNLYVVDNNVKLRFEVTFEQVK